MSAFVEMWQPDTNTLYMSFGKMTVTFYNVELIHGIPAYGTVVDTMHTREQLLCIVNSDFDVRYTGTRNDYSRDTLDRKM